jgi:hypothetical protein
MNNGQTRHFKAALHVLRYLKSTRNYCIVYRKSANVPIIDVVGYSGSDFASDEDDRKPYTGDLFIINGSAVSWSTHKQSTVAFSSMEAGIYGIIGCSKRGARTMQLFSELQLKISSQNLKSAVIIELSTVEERERPAMHIRIEAALVGVVWLMQYAHGSWGPSNAAAPVFPLWN